MSRENSAGQGNQGRPEEEGGRNPTDVQLTKWKSKDFTQPEILIKAT